jgi:hypothetical protein
MFVTFGTQLHNFRSTSRLGWKNMRQSEGKRDVRILGWTSAFRVNL